MSYQWLVSENGAVYHTILGQTTSTLTYSFAAPDYYQIEVILTRAGKHASNIQAFTVS